MLLACLFSVKIEKVIFCTYLFILKKINMMLHAGVLHKEVQITLSNQNDTGIIILFYLVNKLIDRLLIEHHR